MPKQFKHLKPLIACITDTPFETLFHAGLKFGCVTI